MADELQALLERIDQDGIQKAQAKANQIVAEAQKEAERILAEAKENAAGTLAAAKAETETMSQKSRQAMQQAARQLLLEVRKELQARVVRTVNALVGEAFAPETLPTILSAVCQEYIKKGGKTEDITVLLPAPMLAKLEAQVKARLLQDLKAQPSLAPTRDLAKGFQLSFAGQDVAYDFSDEALSEAIARHLSPAVTAMITE